MPRVLSEQLDLSAKALFISPDGNIFPDTMICSGLIPDQLGGQPCPFSNQGRLPDLIALQADDPAYTADKGAPGDLCPPCAKQQIGPLEHWEWHRGQRFPAELLPLRLFKCHQWFWLVIPGLRNDAPTRLTPSG
jgi:hypothetical protein